MVSRSAQVSLWAKTYNAIISVKKIKIKNYLSNYPEVCFGRYEMQHRQIPLVLSFVFLVFLFQSHLSKLA